jgi:hypothetical protein
VSALAIATTTARLRDAVLRMRTLALVLVTVLASACAGEIGSRAAGPFGSDPIPPGPPGDPGCPPPPGSDSATDRVRLGLAPTCEGCHREGDKGYFASLTAFESLLVRDARRYGPAAPTRASS